VERLLHFVEPVCLFRPGVHPTIIVDNQRLQQVFRRHSGTLAQAPYGRARVWLNRAAARASRSGGGSAGA
jgi:hypothetical protein